VARRVDPLRGAWRIDLHTHTWASPDSQVDPRALVERAQVAGLARFAVTDHNTIEGALAAQALAPDFVIVGEEIETATGGELIAYFVSELVPPGLSLDETIHRLRAQGAVISISHPLDRLRGTALGERDTLAVIDRVDALEGFNARCLLAADNRRAQALAAAHGKATTAGSDAHILAEVGAGYVTLPPFRLDATSFLASLLKGQVGGKLSGLPPHFASTWAKFRK
jgi:predicted metal-dependent phosphoesterase TrpH